MFSTDPASVASFRENTHKKDMRLFSNTFRCKRCKVVKQLTGRKRAGSSLKDGWICAHCYEIREAKKKEKQLLAADNT